MIVQIEDYFGDTIGAVMVTENDIETGELKVLGTTGDISIADIDFDDIFDTNEEKVRIQMELKHLTVDKPKSICRTGNEVGFYHENDRVKNLMQELKSYEALLESFEKGDYYNCHILIFNYFGHIDYGDEFGYFKSHEEICYILSQNLCAQLTEGHSDSFTNFVGRQIAKIKWNLENDCGIKNIDECFNKGELP